MSGMPGAAHATGWRPGFRVGVSAWLDPAAAEGPVFRTGRGVGELAVEAAGARLPALIRMPMPSAGAILVEHDGIHAGRGGQPPAFSAAVTGPGCLSLRGLTAPASLFSPEQEPAGAQGASWLDFGPWRLALVASADDPGRAGVALADADTAVALARAALARDPLAAFATGRAARAALAQLPSGEETPAALAGFETMAGALRAPAGPFPARWCDTGGGCMEFQHLPALLVAWSAWDPAVARELLESAVACLRPDGRLPAWVNAAGEASPHGAPPGFARAAADLLAAHPDPALCARLEPILRQHLAWWLTHSDPQRRGVPVWPAAESSVTPDLFNPDVTSAGLAGLLMHDLDGLARVAAAAPEPDRDDRWMQVEHERLLDLLEHHFRREADGVFADRAIGGDHVRRIGASAWLAAGSIALPAAFRERALRVFEGPSSLLTPEGVRAWVPWPEDTSRPPVPLALQLPVLQALEADPESRRGARAEQVVRRRLVALADRFDALPPELSGQPAEPVWHPAAGALLLHLVAKGAGTLSARPLTPAMRWIERRRRTLGLALVGGIALVLIGAMVASTMQRQDPHGPQVTLAGLAKNKYLLQDYPAAVRLYGQLLAEFPAGEMRGDYHFLRGNAQFHLSNFALAEADYREAIRLRPDYIQPRWNLIQVLHRQGRLGDALAVVAETEAKLGPKGDPGLRQRLADARVVLTGLVAQRAAEPTP